MQRGPLRPLPRALVESRDVGESVALAISAHSYSAFAELVQPLYRAAGRYPLRTALLGAKNRMGPSVVPGLGDCITRTLDHQQRRPCQTHAAASTACSPDRIGRRLARTYYSGMGFAQRPPSNQASRTRYFETRYYRACLSFPRWLSRLRSKTSRSPSRVR